MVILDGRCVSSVSVNRLDICVSERICNLWKSTNHTHTHTHACSGMAAAGAAVAERDDRVGLVGVGDGLRHEGVGAELSRGYRRKGFRHRVQRTLVTLCVFTGVPPRGRLVCRPFTKSLDSSLSL